jgi:hypothetical protein
LTGTASFSYLYFTMMFSLQTLFVAITLLASSAHAFPNGAGGCSGGEAAVMGFHLSTSGGKVITTGSLADGGVGLVLDGVPLDPMATTARNFSTSDIHVLTLAGLSPYRGMLVRLSSPSGVDTTSSLLETSDDLQDAGACSAPVVGITHTNSNLKNAQSMQLSMPSEGEITIDVTVVIANNSTDSIYYYSGYTLNAVMPTAVEAGTSTGTDTGNAVCEVCGAGLVVSILDATIYNPLTMMRPTCAEIQAGGQAGIIAAQFCSVLPGVIAIACGCEAASRTGDAVDDTSGGGGGGEETTKTSSPPTMAPDTMSGAASGQQQQTLVALAVSGLVATVALL